MRLDQVLTAIMRGDDIFIRRDGYTWLKVLPRDTPLFGNPEMERATTLIYLEDLASHQWTWEPRQYTASEVVSIWRKEPERVFRPVEREEGWDAQFGLLEMNEYLNSKWVDAASASEHPGGWEGRGGE